jgi:hypothetical protein
MLYALVYLANSYLVVDLCILSYMELCGSIQFDSDLNMLST